MGQHGVGSGEAMGARRLDMGGSVRVQGGGGVAEGGGEEEWHESRIQGKREGTSLMSHRISYFIFYVFVFRTFIYHVFVQSYCW